MLNRILIWIIIFLIGIGVCMGFNIFGFIIYVVFLIVLEIFFCFLIPRLRKIFPWLITQKDEVPVIDSNGLDKFMAHGFDAELGWVRKPNTSKKEIGKKGISEYHIDHRGSRKNPGHESLPIKISCYGDSFTFARQVDDDSTFEWYLSEMTKTNVLNFGVGNYGLDQALLRLKREFCHNKSRIVIMGVVPSTIARVLCMWKHYNEFGNTFAFKPMFKLIKGNLKLIKNKIDSREKFFNIKQN